MTDSLLDEGWYRVSHLRPRLAPGTSVQRQSARGRIWHVLADASSGRQVRLNGPAYQFVGRWDGEHSVNQIWQQLLGEMGDGAPTQPELLRLISQLYAGGMVQFDAAPNLAALFAQRDERVSSKQRAWINPLVIRVRLFNPAGMVNRLLPRLRWLMTLPVLLLWALLVTLGAAVCVIHFGELHADFARLLQAPRTLVIFWLCFPPIKALHELAHALMVRRFGGNLRDAGITLMFFTPAPYVDASSASAFQSRAQRIAVSAAGIIVELCIAALAALLWAAVEPGLVRDVCLVLLMTCGISALAINANPLLRFDGYYIATDALDLPNLAMRSNAWWTMFLRRLVPGAAPAAAPVLASGERKWLVAYAPASLLYRGVLMLTLVLWVGAKSWLLGMALALGLFSWMVMRAVAGLQAVAGSAGAGSRRWSGVGALGAGVVIAVIMLFAVPVPHSVVAQGVVWPPDDAQVRAETAGFVTEVRAVANGNVEPGNVVVALADPNLEAEQARLQSQLAGYQAREYAALLRDPGQASLIAEDIARTEAELARAEQRIAHLEVASKSAGRLILPRADDLAGSFVPAGSMLGYVLPAGDVNVRAALDEGDALLVRNHARGAQVRLAETGGEVVAASIGRDMPAATRILPSASLGDRAGGSFATDPDDKDGTRTQAAVYLVDVTVPKLAQERIGGRAWVRFDLGSEPVGAQVSRRVRQLFLMHFNPTAQP